MILKRIATAIACALLLAFPASAQLIGSGHVLGNGTSASSSPTDTPLIQVMNQSGSGIGTGNATALGISAGTSGGFIPTTGVMTPGDCVSISSGPTLIDAHVTCGSGGGGGSGTVASGTTGQLATYANSGTTVSGSLCTVTSSGALFCPAGQIGAGTPAGTGTPPFTVLAAGETGSDFNPVGWASAGGRVGTKITSTSSQPGFFVGCDINGSVSSIAEYDCGWFQAIDVSHGTSSAGTNAVAERDESIVPAGNSTGAVWAGIDFATISAGGDGQAIGREIDITNNGSDDTFPNNAGMKTGIFLASDGPVPATAALAIAPSTVDEGFNFGLWATSVSINKGFLWLDGDDSGSDPLFSVVNTGKVQSAVGYAAVAGTGGANSGHVFNINFTGSASQLFIDSTNEGTISLTSDPRVKHNIEPMAGDALDRVMELRPVSFNWADVGIYRDDHQRHDGFLADEVQRVIPDAANGKPDAMNADGTPDLMSLNPIPLIATLTKGVQELKSQLDAERSCSRHILCRLFGVGA